MAVWRVVPLTRVYGKTKVFERGHQQKKHRKAMTKRAIAVKDAPVPKARKAFPFFVKEKTQLQRGQGARQDHQDEMKRLTKVWAALPASVKEAYKLRSKAEFEMQCAALRVQGAQRRGQKKLAAPAPCAIVERKMMMYEACKVQSCGGKNSSVLGIGTCGKIFLAVSPHGRRCAIKVFSGRRALQ